MNNELEIRRITEQVLKDQNLWNLSEIYKKEHNIFRGTHKGVSAELSWDKISGKPSTFPPSSHTHPHTHPGTDITSIVAEAAKLTASGFSLSSLIANNKVPDSDKLDGYHHDTFLKLSGGTFTSHVYAADHGTAATDRIVNVCYGTGSPPAAGGTTIGTIWLKYT